MRPQLAKCQPRTTPISSTEQPSTEPPAFECPFAYGAFPNPYDCKSFYVCVHSKPYKHYCERDLHFSRKHGECRDPRIAGCQVETSTTTKPSTEPPAFECPFAYGAFPNPYDCKSFYVCVHSKPYKHYCKRDLHFSRKHGECRDPRIAGCRVETSTSDYITSTTSTTTTSPTTTTTTTRPSPTTTTTTSPTTTTTRPSPTTTTTSPTTTTEIHVPSTESTPQIISTTTFASTSSPTTSVPSTESTVSVTSTTSAPPESTSELSSEPSKPSTTTTTTSTTESTESTTESTTELISTSSTTLPIDSSSTTNVPTTTDNDTNLDLTKICNQCSTHYLRGHPKSNNLYISCHDKPNHHVVLQCSNGLIFDSTKLTCDYQG